MLISESKVSVRYAETDKLGKIYYSHYLIYFEIGRIELFNKYIMQYKEFENIYGLCLPVTEVYAKMISSSNFGDELIIITTLTELPSRIFRFDYEIKKEKLLIATGRTINPIVEICSNKIKSFPPELSEKIKTYFI